MLKSAVFCMIEVSSSQHRIPEQLINDLHTWYVGATALHD